jgi:hypothetical protein
MSIGDGGSFGTLSLQAGPAGTAWCNTYPDTTPILTIGAGSTTVCLSVAGQTVPAEAAKFAAQLATQAARFAAECDRLHAAQQAHDQARDKGQAAKAAGDAA